MNILFVHDHPFRKVDEKFYSTGAFNNAVFGRYTKNCSRLVVIARIVHEESVNDRWSLITDPKVTIKGKKGFRHFGLEDEIKECDKMIVRLPSFMGIQALDINKRYKKPYLIEMVSCPWDALWNHGLTGKAIAPFMMLKNKQLVKKAPYVIYVTKEFLQRRYPSLGKTIGCSDVEIAELDDSIETRRIEKIKGEAPVLKIGTVAAINVPYKGQEYVIRALGELKKRGNTHYEYYLVGNGSKERLEQIAKECDVVELVHFLGGMPHEKVYTWLDSIDLYIQPSKQEGLPRALVEAMSRGLPALGSITGGIPELLSNKYLHKKGDYKSIATILELLSKDDLIQMSRENFIRASDYRKEKLDKERNGFYREFLEK